MSPSLMPRAIGWSSIPSAMMPRVLCLPCWPWWLIHVSPSTWRPKPPSHSRLFQPYLEYVLPRADVERVRRRADADNRPARLDVIHDVLHLLIGQIAKPREDDHQVGGRKCFETRDVVFLNWD